MKITLTLLLAAVGTVLISASSGPVSLDWLGQSCFIMKSPGGTTILLDPYNEMPGYKIPKVKADAVTVSHEHGDHNNVSMAEGSPRAIRGLTPSTDWAKVDEKVGDVHIRTVGVYHDDKQGAERGKDAVFIFETGGLALVHLGDLGHVLTPEQVKAIGKTDVLMIPVGGKYTIDAAAAAKVMAQLSPRIVIPMHYKTPECKIPLSGVDAFIEGRENVKREKGSTLEIADLPEKPEIVVLEPRE